MIDKKQKIKLNSVEQKIHIRGTADKPVILFVHGGPGLCNRHEIMVQDDLAKNFILVAWDQRGTGGSYIADQSHLTNDKLVEDTHELILWLIKEFKQKKIIVAGISWGSVLTSLLADRHPDTIAAVINYGQAVSSHGEKLSYDFALKAARDANNQKSIRVLEEIGAPIDGKMYRGGLEDLMKQRRILCKYGGWSPNPKRQSYYSAILRPILKGLLSGEYSIGDVIGIAKGSSESVKKLILEEYPDFDLAKTNTRFNVPYFIFQGREDWVCPSGPVEEYFNLVHAPKKELVWFDKSGHDPMADEPAKFADGTLRVSREISFS